MKIQLSVLALMLLPFVTLGQISWDIHYISPDHDGASFVSATDLDQDGDMDLLGTASTDNDLIWWENVYGDGNTWNERTIDYDILSPFCALATDLDLDGDLDILAASSGDNRVIFYKNLTGNALDWELNYISDSWSGALIIDFGDFDQDGDTDVVAAAEVNGSGINWWENQNQGTTWLDNDLTDSAARSVHVADVSGDGVPDIIGGINGDLKVFKNLNGGQSWWIVGISDFAHPIDITSGDFDNDSDLDFCVAGGDEVLLYENSGDGVSWIEHAISSNFSGAHSVYAVDVDCDGDLDLVGAASTAGKIVWWENTQGLSLWLEHTISDSFPGAYNVCASDINGDGLPDVSCAGNGQFVWWEQLAPPYTELQLASPNGGEAWRQNTVHDIQWESSSDQDVVIELLLGPTVERVISGGTDNDGVFEWTIPDDATPGDNYRIRVILADGSEQDVSDAAFAITALPTLSIEPILPPIIIPASGYGFWYWLEIGNPSPFEGTGQYWSEVVLPSGNTFGPLSVNLLTIEAFGSYVPDEPLAQWIPGYAPAGTYQYVMHVGIYPNMIVATDSFEFEKLAGSSVASLPESAWKVEDWQNSAWEQASAAVTGTESLPTAFSVSPAYPNPFNASTSLTVSLPEPAELTVTVYDVLGREVATLAHCQHSAGEHRLTFGASNLASGLYFIRATVPGHLDQVQKVMLVR